MPVYFEFPDLTLNVPGIGVGHGSLFFDQFHRVLGRITFANQNA
jgi:hypothetical protein